MSLLRCLPSGEPLSPARQAKYRPGFAALAERFCALGARDIELANAFDVSLRTINTWKLTKPKFAAALKAGKAVADERVVDALYQRAVGYSFDSVKINVSEGRLFETPIIEHVPPDIQAIRFWLSNRRPNEWQLMPVSAPQGEGEDFAAMIAADKPMLRLQGPAMEPDEPVPLRPVL